MYRGVGLDEIMDVGVGKVTVNDPNDEEDLILPNKDINRLHEPPMKPLRKSPRFIEQDCVRNLRQQPTEKQSSPSKVKSVFPPEHEVKRSKRSSSPSEQIHTSSSGSRRSTRAAHKQFTDKILTAEQKDENQLSNTCDETRDPLPLELKDHSENANLFILSKEKCDKEQCVISEPVLTHSQTTNHTVAELLTQTADEHVYEEEIFNTDKKTDVIYDNVHKELALLSGVVKCDLDVEKIAHSSVSDGSLENPIDQKVTVTDIAESNISTYNELVKEEEKLLTSGKKMLQEEKGSIKLSNVKKGLRKQKSTSDKAKPHLQPSSKTPKKVTAIKNTRMNLKSQKGKASGLKRADSFTGHVNNPERQNVVKVKKMLPENIKNVVGSSNEKLTKNVCSGEKTANLDNPIKHHMEDLSDNHCGFRDIAHPSQAHVRTRTKSLSQSTEKASKNLLSTISKASFQGKDFGEQTEALDTSEEKPKLKKSVPPRQRRSSKSISVDEPQLFVPDNIPAVKKDGTELTCASDTIAGSSIRHCCSCRKLHGNKFMVGCGRCDDWFHGECLGLSLSQAQHMETEDKEYLCPKCCAEDEAMEANDSSVYDNHQKIEVRQENKKESEKSSIKSSPISSPGISHDNPKQREDSKHKVKALRKDSGDGKQVTDSKDGDLKKHALLQRKAGATETHQNSEEKHERPSKELSNSQCNDEKNTKLGVHEKQDNKKKKQERKGPPPNLQTSSPPTPKPSIDQIRQSVRQSLKDILQKRISESSSKIPEERAIKVSSRIEKELFSFYRDTDSKYKNKYRSLMFNLKDPKNKVLYKRVLKGEITPEHLIKMSPEELASRELAAWRQRENRHTIEMIEKEQREAERRPITKITHKGEIEIESETPMKETEVMDSEEISVKPAEKEEEIQKEEELATESSDTTSHHKNHLFDLNCKICTGRMAPPAEEISPKKATNSSGLLHKQSDNGADGIAEPLSSSTSMLKIDALEGGKQEPLHDRLSSTASSSEQFHITDTAEDESTFLARLNLIWQGFLNMPSVAKFVIKAYPVSGSLEHLAEDLPESIQVGGRISPQTVWDYVDKIKASGTKETCVVRFCPVAEEDQITYTLLYSYFSSRKRYGVVANNMRQVKDMYLIPLGASEKIPHFFVPFDGPGLEANRPNLLLALIIRQKVKRLHSISIDDEPPGGLLGVPAEKKSRVECNDDDEEEDEKNDFFNSCSAVLHKNRNRPQPSDTEEPQAVTECVPETVKLGPQKPLRFLPGVLVGWENPQSTLDLASRPLPVEDILQSLLGTTENTFDHKPVSSQVKKSLIEDTSSIIEVAEKSDDIIVQTETVEESTSLITVSATNLQGISLKGKPPDVSTDTYLSNINYNEESLDDDIYQSTEDKNDFDTYAHLNKMSSDESNSVSGENTTPTPSHTKRDPRQAAGRGHHINSSDIKDQDLSNIEENTSIDQEDMESISLHKKDKSKKQSYREKDLSKGGKSLQYSLTMEKEIDYKPSKASETKPFLHNILIDDTDPLQQFRRALAANKAQSQTLNNPQSQTSSAPYTETSKNSIPSFGGLKLQQSPFLSVKNNPSLFPFQHNPSFSLQSNAIFPYPPHIPPLLPTPLGMGFPRPPRFTSTDHILHNPLVAWHPAMQLSRQPPPYLGQVKPGPLLGPEQTRYQMQQTFAHKDHRPERRHSDPWDKQDRISERSSSRGSRGEYRQRYYSESHHSREKRQYEKDSDKDSERSRRRERDKESARDRDRKSRDDSHREKDRSKSSYSDKSGDRTHKESKSVDKSKNEERIHDKEKSKERNRDREEEKEREKSRREKALDHSDRIKSRK